MQHQVKFSFPRFLFEVSVTFLDCPPSSALPFIFLCCTLPFADSTGELRRRPRPSADYRGHHRLFQLPESEEVIVAVACSSNLLPILPSFQCFFSVSFFFFSSYDAAISLEKSPAPPFSMFLRFVHYSAYCFFNSPLCMCALCVLPDND